MYIAQEYEGTYYVQIKNEDGSITTHEKINGNSPLEVARHFKPDAKKCKKEESFIYVISNAWRYGKSAKNNYYK